LTDSTTSSGTDQDEGWFAAKVEEFSGELSELLNGVVDLDGTVEATILDCSRALIELVDANGIKHGPVLTIRGKPAVRLLLRYGIGPDSSGRYLALTRSDLSL